MPFSSRFVLDQHHNWVDSYLSSATEYPIRCKKLFSYALSSIYFYTKSYDAIALPSPMVCLTSVPKLITIDRVKEQDSNGESK